MDGSVYYGANKAGAQDAVTIAGGSSGMTGTFKCYTTTAIAGAAAGANSVPILYNPAGSGVVLRILRVSFGAVAGTVIAACITYGVQSSPVLTVLTPWTGANQHLHRTWSYLRRQLVHGRHDRSGAHDPLPQRNLGGRSLRGGPLVHDGGQRGRHHRHPAGCAFWPYISNAALAMTALVTVDVLQTPWVSGY